MDVDSIRTGSSGCTTEKDELVNKKKGEVT